MGHACSQVAWMQFVSRARTQADPAAATVTRSAIQGLSKEESRELDVARRGLGSQRGAGRSVALSQIEYNIIWDDGVGVGTRRRRTLRQRHFL